MPRKKKTIIEENIPDNAIVTDDGETVNMDLGLDGMFDAIGEQPFLVKVYRITTSGSSYAFSTTEKPTAEFESIIQDRCPTGGKFAIRTYINNRIQEPTRYVEIEPKQVVTPTTGVTPNDLYSMQVKMLTDQLMSMQNIVLAFIGRPTPIAQNTPMSELVSMMTVLNANKPDSQVDTLLKGITLAKELNGGGGDWKSELVSTAKHVLPGAIDVIKNQQAIQRNPQQVTVNTPMITERNPSPMDFNSIAKYGISLLKPKIVGGLDVEDAVNWVLANGNDPMYQPFLTIALEGDINTFISLDPQLANEPYRSWITNAITLIKEAYADNRDNDGGTGNGTDITAHAPNSVGVPHITKVG